MRYRRKLVQQKQRYYEATDVVIYYAALRRIDIVGTEHDESVVEGRDMRRDTCHKYK